MIIAVFCVLFFILYLVNVHNSPQIFWFSRRYLPYFIVISLLLFLHTNINKFIVTIVLIFLIIAMNQKNYFLSNFKGVVNNLKANHNIFNSELLYFYSEEVNYRYNLSAFLNFYKIKFIPLSHINYFQDQELRIVTKKNCEVFNMKKEYNLQIDYHRIRHNLTKVPKKYSKINSKINICK